MRHRIVHVYYEIDADALWEVATVDLPVLVTALERALQVWPRTGTGGPPTGHGQTLET